MSMSMSSLLLCFFFLFSLLPVGDSAHHPSPAPTAATVAAESQTTTFRPSIAVIVGLLTTIFSLTFLLLLLYLKHCLRRSAAAHPYLGAPVAGRKNSGINRAVIESLPLFRFDSLLLLHLNNNNNNNKVVVVVEECAVCLTRFEAANVLRLLPKCKHAFHVECVDTWLDAHSTCPLCRYRVDPEDVLLIHHDIIIQLTPPFTRTSTSSVELVNNDNEPPPPPGYRRISGRHSSAGERGSGAGGFLQFLLQQKRSTRTSTTTGGGGAVQYSFRRSLDVVAASFKKKSGGQGQSVTAGCFDRAAATAAAGGIRKDGLLLPTTNDRATRLERSAAAAAEEERRKLLLLEHRIIVPNSTLPSERQMRWSDVQPSDLLYMQSEMMMIRKLSGGGGRSVINARSVSDITGARRFPEQHIPAITTFIASNVMNSFI